jgi:WD40 repeat protein
MAFSSSGLVLATAGLDKTVRFWDVKGINEVVGSGDAKVKEEVRCDSVTGLSLKTIDVMFSLQQISFSYNTSRSPLLPSTPTSSSTTTGSTTTPTTKPTTTSDTPILRIAFSPSNEDLLAVACASRVRDSRDRDRKEGHDGPIIVLWDINRKSTSL